MVTDSDDGQVARRRAYRVSLRCALDLHLPQPEAHECADDFLCTMLAPCVVRLWRLLPSALRDAYFLRSAHRHAWHWALRWRERHRREVPWPHAAGPGAGAAAWDPAGSDSRPEAELVRHEALRALDAAIADLRPGPRTLLQAWLAGRTIAQLAASTGRTPAAVRTALCAARRHVRATLARRGWTEAEVRDAISSPLPAGADP